MRRLILLAVVSAVGCGAGKPKPTTTRTPASTPAPAAVSVGEPVTKAEARKFADELERAVEGKPAALARTMRLREVYERSVADLGLSPDHLTEVRTAFDPAAVRCATDLTDEVAAGGRYDLVRVRTRDGKPAVLFRLIQADGGINYHEYPLVRHPDGVGPADMHVLANGEPVSASVRRPMARLAAELDRDLLGRLTGAERLMIDNTPKLEMMSEHRRAGRPVLVLNTFRSLPPALQADKGVLMSALLAAERVSDREYLGLMERFREAYPDDPALAWLDLDYHFVRNDYPRALAAVDRLDELLGGDRYLDTLRAGLHARLGHKAEAAAAAERLVVWAPAVEWGYQAGVQSAVEAKDYTGAVAWYKRGVTAEALDVDLRLVRTEAKYAAFRRSTQFAELEKWLTGRTKKSGPAR